jgi:hypothetical protein
LFDQPRTAPILVRSSISESVFFICWNPLILPLLVVSAVLLIPPALLANERQEVSVAAEEPDCLCVIAIARSHYIDSNRHITDALLAGTISFLANEGNDLTVAGCEPSTNWTNHQSRLFCN